MRVCLISGVGPCLSCSTTMAHWRSLSGFTSRIIGQGRALYAYKPLWEGRIRARYARDRPSASMTPESGTGTAAGGGLIERQDNPLQRAGRGGRIPGLLPGGLQEDVRRAREGKRGRAADARRLSGAVAGAKIACALGTMDYDNVCAESDMKAGYYEPKSGDAGGAGAKSAGGRRGENDALRAENCELRGSLGRTSSAPRFHNPNSRPPADRTAPDARQGAQGGRRAQRPGPRQGRRRRPSAPGRGQMSRATPPANHHQAPLGIIGPVDPSICRDFAASWQL